jgi:hypothetical protein|nr:MAG TPA: hypothetical protein [Caudoviricetes sp.]
MAMAKYSGNMRQTGIGVKELKQLIRIGDRFDYTYDCFSAEDFGDSSKPKKKTDRVEVIKLYPDLVKLRVLKTGKEMIVSFADILLYSNKKSLQPFKEEKL